MAEEFQDPSPPLPNGSDDEDKASWMDRLAQRSAGLPSPSDKKPPQEKTPLSVAGMGLQFVGTAVLFAVMGYYLDQYMHWSPWAMIVCTTIGVIGGFYLMIKEALRINK